MTADSRFLPNCGAYSASSARLIVVAGTLLLETGGVPEALHADGALIADVLHEVSRIRIGKPSFPVSLARGETTATLLAKAEALFPEFRDFRVAALALGIVDLHDGLGMLATLGKTAALVAIKEQDVRSHVDRELTIPLMRLRNGTLRQASVWTLNSLAGGVGAMAGRLFASVASDSLRELTSATVDIFSFQVGALTFLGLGERILDNAAAGLVEHLAFALDIDCDPRESRQLLLTELPVVDMEGTEIDTNRALRSALAVSLVSAFSSAAVQEKVRTGRTNRALASCCGAIALLRPDWYGLLGRDDVVAEAARHYAGALSSGMTDPGALVPPIAYVTTAVPPRLRPIEDLVLAVARQNGSKPAGFDGDALATSSFLVSLRLGGRPFEKAVSDMAERVVSVGLAAVIAELRALDMAVSAAAAAARNEEARQALREATAKVRLRAAISLVFPVSLSASAKGFLLGPRKKVERFRSALVQWREEQLKHAGIMAKREALDSAAGTVNSALKRVTSISDRLMSTLSSLAAPAQPELFLYEPADEVSAELVRCVMKGDIALLRSVLAQSARGVTLDGLAHVVKAPTPQLADVVARLASRPQYSAPFWGGGDPSGPPFLRVVVLPPLVPGLIAALKEAATRDGLGIELLAGDTLAGGAAVVGLAAYETRSITDLFAAPYFCGLREITGPKARLYPLSAKARKIAEGVQEGGTSCAR